LQNSINHSKDGILKRNFIPRSKMSSTNSEASEYLQCGGQKHEITKEEKLIIKESELEIKRSGGF
jgi:hypothetical protein